MWKNDHFPVIEILDPKEYGWQLINGQLIPVYFLKVLQVFNYYKNIYVTVVQKVFLAEHLFHVLAVLLICPAVKFANVLENVAIIQMTRVRMMNKFLRVNILY